MVLSQPNALQFEFSPGSHDHALGFGTLRVCLGKSPIWSDEQDRGIAWTWIDLLEKLARAWPYLKYDESAPPGAYDGMLSLLRNGHPKSSDFFAPAPESTRETYIFLRRHNLATGIEGMYLPSFSILREGLKVWVASANIARPLDFEPTMHTLAQLGDEIAEHISSANSLGERSRLALKAWTNREPALEAALHIELGSSRLAAEMVPSGQTMASYFEVQNEGIFESTLLLAARMSEAVPVESRRKIIELLRSRPATGESSFLKETSAEAQSAIPEWTRRPYEQGALLAQWARKQFQIAPQSKADPEKVLKELGVDISQHSLGIEMIDAIGCWGPSHGPAILVNVDGKHAQATPGRRATLAHELAHVLVDRKGSLPAAEVFGGNVPRQPEQRANAFAAEFLLPKAVLIEQLRRTTDTVRTIKSLRFQYGVSQELAAWQILNTRAAAALDDEGRELLRSWAPGAEGRDFFDRDPPIFQGDY